MKGKDIVSATLSLLVMTDATTRQGREQPQIATIKPAENEYVLVHLLLNPCRSAARLPLTFEIVTAGLRIGRPRKMWPVRCASSIVHSACNVSLFRLD
jgi:hypothetical protein